MPGLAFQLLEERESRSVAEWRPEAAGLAVGVWCTALLQPALPVPPLSASALWRLAVTCTIPVFAAAAAAFYLACRMTRPGRNDLGAAMGFACAMVWLPPAVLTLRQGSAAGTLLAAALAAAGTRALLGPRAPGGEPGRLMPSLGTAVALEAGALCIAVEDWRIAAIPFSIAAALLTWLLSKEAIWPLTSHRRRGLLRQAAAQLLAVAFSAGALTPYLAAHGHGASDPAAFLMALFAPPRGGAQPNEASDPHVRPQYAVPQEVVIGDVHPAVVLWPEVEPYTLLVPPLLASSRGLFAGSAAATAGIPFSGFYSFQRATVLPPKQHYVTHGDPAELNFRTTDSSPLVMEAHQDFGKPIDIRCCREIGLVLRIADPEPASVKLRLILRDRRAPDQPWLVLGTERLRENVTFRMPAASSLREFDRATVRFLLTGARWDRSAKVAIRRFSFVQ